MPGPAELTIYSTKRSLEEGVRKLTPSGIFPVASLNFMLLKWQRGQLEEVTLSDSDSEDGDGDNEEVQEKTLEEYKLYVHPLTHIDILLTSPT